jgi:hypothetical protein
MMIWKEADEACFNVVDSRIFEELLVLFAQYC